MNVTDRHPSRPGRPSARAFFPLAVVMGLGLFIGGRIAAVFPVSGTGDDLGVWLLCAAGPLLFGAAGAGRGLYASAVR